MDIKDNYKKIFDDAWKKHRIRVDIKPFPKYRNENGYYGYIYYRKKGDANLSLWTREASTIDKVCDKCVESVQQLIKSNGGMTMSNDEQFIDFKKEVEKLKEIDGAEEYAKQLAHLFLGNGLSLQTILLMAIDFGQQHSQWIPVEERLPEENGKTQQSVSVWATNGLTSGEFRYNFDTKTWTDMWGDPFDITHWMPLPMLPRKEE